LNVFSGARESQTTVLLLVPDLHGHRRLRFARVTCQGNLRVDPEPFSVLSGRSSRLEELGATQLIPQQMFQQSGESAGKACDA